MSGTNTSATGGYLAPASSSVDDDTLEDQLQAIVAGISGLPGNLVRPRWQPTPPNRPTRETTWCAIGITSVQPDDNAYVVHNPAADSGAGRDELQRHEELSLLATFYGPMARATANATRDGLQIDQNREWMQLNEMGLVSVGSVDTMSEMVNGQFIDRYDLMIIIRRRVLRSYRVLHFESASGIINAEESTTPWQVES